MSHLGEDLINIIIQYKGVFIAIILLTVGKYLKFYYNNFIFSSII